MFARQTCFCEGDRFKPMAIWSCDLDGIPARIRKTRMRAPAKWNP
jgi:hypothetical protein